MKTVIYLIRHSGPMIKNYTFNETEDSLLLKNMKQILSIEGEKFAERISNNEEFKDVNYIVSSNYVRTLSTAKYFCKKNDLNLIIDERLNERIHGVDSWDELVSNFEIKQIEDAKYKMLNGESREEVSERMNLVLQEILKNNLGKKVLIIGHSTATLFLLMKWCKIKKNKLFFKDKMIFDGEWRYCETFKLEFDDNLYLLTIENIKWSETYGK